MSNQIMFQWSMHWSLEAGHRGRASVPFRQHSIGNVISISNLKTIMIRQWKHLKYTFLLKILWIFHFIKTFHAHIGQQTQQIFSFIQCLNRNIINRTVAYKKINETIKILWIRNVFGCNFGIQLTWLFIFLAKVCTLHLSREKIDRYKLLKIYLHFHLKTN